MELEDADRSRHSSESREDKPPSRDGRERDRDRDRSQPNYQVCVIYYSVESATFELIV